MVDVWVLPPEIGTIDDEGIVRLSDGRTFDLASVAGNGYNANRLAKINEAIQAALDVRVLRTSLPIEDPDRDTDPNNPGMFYGDEDGAKNPAGLYIIRRPAVIYLTWDGANLIPHCEVPR